MKNMRTVGKFACFLALLWPLSAGAPVGGIEYISPNEAAGSTSPDGLALSYDRGVLVAASIDDRLVTRYITRGNNSPVVRNLQKTFVDFVNAQAGAPGSAAKAGARKLLASLVVDSLRRLEESEDGGSIARTSEKEWMAVFRREFNSNFPESAYPDGEPRLLLNALRRHGAAFMRANMVGMMSHLTGVARRWKDENPTLGTTELERALEKEFPVLLDRMGVSILAPPEECHFTGVATVEGGEVFDGAPILDTEHVLKTLEELRLAGTLHWERREAWYEVVTGDYAAHYELYAPSAKSPDSANQEDVGGMLARMVKPRAAWTPMEALLADIPQLGISEFNEMVVFVSWRDRALLDTARAIAILNEVKNPERGGGRVRLRYLAQRNRDILKFVEVAGDSFRDVTMRLRQALAARIEEKEDANNIYRAQIIELVQQSIPIEVVVYYSEQVSIFFELRKTQTLNNFIDKWNVGLSACRNHKPCDSKGQCGLKFEAQYSAIRPIYSQELSPLILDVFGRALDTQRCHIDTIRFFKENERHLLHPLWAFTAIRELSKEELSEIERLHKTSGKVISCLLAAARKIRPVSDKSKFIQEHSQPIQVFAREIATSPRPKVIRQYRDAAGRCLYAQAMEILAGGNTLSWSPLAEAMKKEFELYEELAEGSAHLRELAKDDAKKEAGATTQTEELSQLDRDIEELARRRKIAALRKNITQWQREIDVAAKDLKALFDDDEANIDLAHIRARRKEISDKQAELDKMKTELSKLERW